MSENETLSSSEVTVDLDSLYKEEVFTDTRAATIRRMSPVLKDGGPDSSRPVLFVGETSLLTQMGPIPVNFPIEVDSLEKAFEEFPKGVEAAVARLSERAKEMARQEASRIVVPTNAPPSMGGGGMPGGGVPGGGKIVLK